MIAFPFQSDLTSIFSSAAQVERVIYLDLKLRATIGDCFVIFAANTVLSK